MSLRTEYCRTHGIGDPPRWAPWRGLFKRLFDLAVCVPALLLTAPLLLITAVLIRLDSRGPVLFVQERLGRYGRTFRTWKFRTMTDRERTVHTEILPGHSEVTRVGRWLRRFKIDELPQLVNILRGEMSFVGPRPALPGHIADYNRDGLRRLLERPGLTGLAQVHGNIYLSWPDRWAWDARYVDRLSASLDVWILLRTIGVVLLGEERFLARIEPAKPFGDASADRQAA